MKKKTKENISKVFTILGVIGLCYLIFVDRRPKKYVEIVGLFDKYDVKEKSGRYGTRHDNILINEHPTWFNLERNGRSYHKIEKYFSTTSKSTRITLVIDENEKNDTIHSRLVYRILVNDSVIFNRMQEDAVVTETISLIKN